MERSEARVALLLLGGLALLPWLAAGRDWPALLVARLDHCPRLACDFALHYLPQARLLAERPGELTGTWVYPPLLALLLRPLAGLSTGAAVLLWTGLELLAALGLALLAARELRARWGGLALPASLALVSVSLPVLHGLKWGQLSPFLALGASWALAARGRGRGAVLGLLAGLKVYPLLYAPLLAWRREQRAFASALAWAALLGLLLPLALLGDAAWPFFQRVWSVHLVHLGAQGGQALGPAFERWFLDGAQLGDGWAPGDPPAPPRLFALGALYAPALWLARLAVAAGTLLGLLRARGDRPREAQLVLAGWTLLLSPGWHHYFAWLPVAQAVVLGRSSPRRAAWWLAALSALGSALPVLLLPAWPGAYFAFSGWGVTTLAALAAWAGLLALPRARA